MEKNVINKLKIEVFDLNDALIKKDAEIKKIQQEMAEIQQQINERLVTIKQLNAA